MATWPVECGCVDPYAVGAMAYVTSRQGVTLGSARFRGVSAGTACAISPDMVNNEYDMVTIEEMPEQYRSSHRAARNWGRYPHNGATRREVSRDEAEEIVAADEDGYDHIVE